MKGLKILVGGDFLHSSSLISRALQQRGHSVIAEVRTGREAVASAKTLRPDLVILDVCLPGLNGLEACRILTAEMSIPTILVGSQADDDLVRQACDAGAMAYVLKPIDNLLSPSMEFAVCKFREIESLRQEVGLLKEALEARKLIERAKGIIMSKLQIGENDAYGILQKYSRDRNLKLRDVAQNIVAANDLFSRSPHVALPVVTR
jgi:response regulator NasT